MIKKKKSRKLKCFGQPGPVFTRSLFYGIIKRSVIFDFAVLALF